MQTQFKLDTHTLRKIFKSAILTAVGAFVAYLLTNIDAVIGAITTNPQLAILMTSSITWGLNTAREWVKGEKQDE